MSRFVISPSVEGQEAEDIDSYVLAETYFLPRPWLGPFSLSDADSLRRDEIHAKKRHAKKTNVHCSG